MVEYHPSSPKDQARIHQFGKKVLPGTFLCYELIAGDSRSGRFGRVGCIRNLSSKNQRKGSIDQTKRWWIHIPDSRWYSKMVRKRLRIPSTHSKAGATCEERSSQWRTSRLTGRVSTDRINRWRWSPCRLLVHPRRLTFIYRHHNEPRVQLNVPKEETFLIPLKYIDVTRSAHTDLDVLQEKRTDDYWNVDGSRDLSDPWTGFTQFTLLEEKPPDGYMWSGWRLTRKTAYIQARSFMARTLEVNGKARQAEGEAKVV